MGFLYFCFRKLKYMKILFYLTSALILILGQSCVSLLSKHDKARFQLETNTPAKVYVYNYKKNDFIPVTQTSVSSSATSSLYDVKFKKAPNYCPTPKKSKKLAKLKKGEELTLHRKNYTKALRKSGQTTVTGHDEIEKTTTKREIILKIVPDNASYSTMYYQTNAVSRGGRQALMVYANLVGGAIILTPIFVSIDAVNHVGMDFPKKISVNLSSGNPQEQPINTTPLVTTPPINNPPVSNTSPLVPAEPKSNNTGLYSEYSELSDTKLAALKQEFLAKNDYEKLELIKKETDLRKAEQDGLAKLQAEMDEKAKNDDFAGAAKAKNDLAALKDKIQKKENLRKEIEVNAENKSKVEELRKELKALN